MVGEDALRSVVKGDTEFVGALDHIGIAQTAGGRNDRLDTRFGSGFDTVFKGEETVAGHDCAFEGGGSGIFFFELDDSLFDGTDAILFSSTDGEGLTVGDDDHAVGTDAQVDMPGENQILFLRFGAFDGGFLFAAAAVAAVRRNQIFDGTDVGQKRRGDDQ